MRGIGTLRIFCEWNIAGNAGSQPWRFPRERDAVRWRDATASPRLRGTPLLHFAHRKSTQYRPMAQYVFTMNRVGKIVPPKRHILKDISLSFFPGAKIGVLGLNGSGKSTLLKIMAGTDTDIEGEARPQPGIKVGLLPQEPQLDPEADVRTIVE